MKQVTWFNREFTFESNQNLFPSILERLSGTPARLEEKLQNVSEETLRISEDNSWSIKENIGHLTDLEPLWQGRFHDILNGAPELRTTDLQNEKTDFASHNDTPLEQLLSDFRTSRFETIAILQHIKEETIFKAALHPRLQKPMRTMDLFLFTAEHDDHHLARITELLHLNTQQEAARSLTRVPSKNQYRVQFDFEISFSNGGQLKATAFRLDLYSDAITDDALAAYVAKDLRLLMVAETKIYNKQILKEAHKRT